MEFPGPTPEINCINCAHAHTPKDDRRCPARDFTCQTMQCSSEPFGPSWKPLGYLLIAGMPLTKTEAAQRAAEELKLERTLSPRLRLERRMGTSIAEQQKQFKNQLATINEAASEYAMTLAQDGGNAMMQTLAKATAVSIIEESLTDDLLKRAVLPLMSKKFGFRTDRDTGGAKPYPISTIRSCVCEVLLHGGRIDGNEFNIIAGGTYFTQAFFKRKVEELGSITNLEISTGEVEIKGRDGFVEVIATWEVDGTPQEFMATKRRAKGREFDGRMVVPVNSAMGRDAIIGKVLARTYKAIYLRSSGAYLSEATAEGEEAIDVESHVVQEDAPPEEDPQEVADNQARLKEDFVNELARAEKTDDVKNLMDQAAECHELTEDTLAYLLNAGRQRWRQLDPKGQANE